jgi:hypothetical protein
MALILLLVALLVVSSGGSAIAAKKRTNRVTGLAGKQYFTMVGFVEGKSANSLDVQVIHGNRFSKPFYQTVKTVQVDPKSTLIRRWTPSGCVPANWGDVSVGDSVSVHGHVVNGVFRANRVTVDVPLTCCMR